MVPVLRDHPSLTALSISTPKQKESNEYISYEDISPQRPLDNEWVSLLQNNPRLCAFELASKNSLLCHSISSLSSSVAAQRCLTPLAKILRQSTSLKSLRLRLLPPGFHKDYDAMDKLFDSVRINRTLQKLKCNCKSFLWSVLSW